ncbi:hypothetical protein NLG97_g7801 [Lecanicillium saksenae]|uniref:Uncharacterized protein n=1 Tax=Lecanicillium saksenae TaxID=468837 RepID=A0ACC1QKT8_9HYPO|nr:hypothetical protein NLG97_g7801 [Lecanicillium saksenae]
MPAATADVSNNGSIIAQDSGSSSIGEPQRQQQQPGQQAQSERELGSLCSSLQAAAAAANNDVREYLLTHSNQRANIVALSRELVEIQTAAKLLVRHCSVSAHESSEQSLLSPVLERLIAVVHLAGKIVADVTNTLESSSSGSTSRNQEALSPEQVTARVGNLTATANICATALNLGLDAMAV